MEIVTMLLTIVAGVLALYIFLGASILHFRRMKILHVSPIPILGNMAPNIFRRISMAELLVKIYNSYPTAKYIGFHYFMTPVIMIRDPELFASITVKNFDNFMDHNGFIDEKLEPLVGKNLFMLRGDEWREMRKILSPMFTSRKMKMMFSLSCKCTDNFTSFLANDARNGKIVDLKDIFSKYTADIVASNAFGIELDSMRDPNNDFFVLGKKSLNLEGAVSLKMLITKNFPFLSGLFGIKVFDDRVTDFFLNIVSDQVKVRKEREIVRPDMIHLMMQSKEKKSNTLELTIEDMTAQAFVFFLGGFETVSTSMCLLVHEITMNPDVRNKLMNEIECVLAETNGKPTYESVMSMKYMDAVISETLRMYPPAIYLERECVKSFEFPAATEDSEPIVITPGTIVWYPSYAVHHDPQYYPEPEKFDPSRFLGKNVDQAIYTPFGLGPRICIGNRFALMTMKLLLLYLLARCDFEPCEKTMMPMALSTTSLSPSAKKGFWLKMRGKSTPSFPIDRCDTADSDGILKSHSDKFE